MVTLLLSMIEERLFSWAQSSHISALNTPSFLWSGAEGKPEKWLEALRELAGFGNGGGPVQGQDSSLRGGQPVCLQLQGAGFRLQRDRA